MLRILFDKNVPYPLRHYLQDDDVKTAEEEGWAQISNGELMEFAERAGYDVLVTCDQNITYQQNMVGRRLSMVVLGSNIWPSVKLKLTNITTALKRRSPGSFEIVEILPPPKRRSLRSSGRG
jgi:hypothetical protein